MSDKKEKKSGFKDSLKSMDTEETFDLIFYRPIGYMWALLAKKLGVTPNAITIASIFLGVGAGVCFFFNENSSPWINYFWGDIIRGVFVCLFYNTPGPPEQGGIWIAAFSLKKKKIEDSTV